MRQIPAPVDVIYGYVVRYNALVSFQPAQMLNFHPAQHECLLLGGQHTQAIVLPMNEEV